jgi:hypothetical protein
MFREHGDQLRRNVDDPLGPELRSHECGAAGLPLQLVMDGHGSAQEVDVTDLQSGCFAQTQPGERADGDERLEPRRCDVECEPDLL